MYGLLLAITTKGVALGVTVLNRLTITIVEGLLLLVAAALRVWTLPSQAVRAAWRLEPAETDGP